MVRRSTKQISSVTSAERASYVATADNAIGNSILPMFIFSRKRFWDHFMRDALQGSVGRVNGSCWTQEVIFNLFHFKTHARPSKENKCIFLDNHISHIALKILNYAKILA